MANTNRIRNFVYLIVSLSIIFHILQISENHQWGDFALYLLQAKAITENSMEGLLALNTFSVNNSNVPTGPNLYPWGFPLLLAPVYYIFGLDIFAFKIYLVIIFGLILITMFFVLKKKLGDYASLLLVGIFAFNPLFISYNNLIQSDLPFLLFCLLTILYIQKTVTERNSHAVLYKEGFLLGTLIFISYFIRSNGIVFLPILLICQLIKKFEERRNIKDLLKIQGYSLSFFFPYFIFFSWTIISNSIFPEGSSSHFNRFEMVNFGTIVDNVFYYLKLPAVFYPGAPLSKIIYYSTLPFAIVGVFYNLRKDYLYVLFCLASISICIIWPYSKGIRFIFPILPFYFYFLLTGMSLIKDKYLPLIKVRIDYAFAILLIFLLVSVFLNRIYKSQSLVIDGPYSNEAKTMFHFISSQTPSEALIIFRKPRSMMLFTNRVSLRENSDEKLLGFPNAYIVVDKMYYNKDRDFEKFDTTMLKKKSLIYKNDRYEIFRNKSIGINSISVGEDLDQKYFKK